jgi:putative ABC transport system permease protein
VVGDTRATLDAPAGPQMYVPYAPEATWGSLSLGVRTTGGVAPAGVAPAVREQLRALDKAIPVYNVKTMDEVLANSVARQRSSALLIGAFAAAALLLALVGIYGITAYYVTQRTHEIGVRIALGARASDVLGLVVGQGLRLTLAGLALGAAGSWALTRVLAGLLYDVKPGDPATFAAVALLLAAVAALACYVPARRATKVDPMVALRYE